MSKYYFPVLVRNNLNVRFKMVDLMLANAQSLRDEEAQSP